MYTYLAVIGWLYVALMASVAEASNPEGTILGAIITFLFYGLLPVSILAYILWTPIRKRALRARELAQAKAESENLGEASSRPEPDAGGHAATDAVPSVRKEP